MYLNEIKSIITALIENEIFSIDLLCEKLNTSRSNLFRQIKKQSGLSTSHFIRQIRLNRANYLLRTSSLTISEISFSVGIQSPQNFSKYYKQYFGITPTQFRKQHAYTDDSSSSQQKSLKGKSQLKQQHSIAVLPFETFGGATDQNYFGDGISEEILFALSQVQSLKTTGRSTAFSFRISNQSIQSIGNELNVANILTGNVRKLDNKVTVVVKLISIADGFQVWLENYEGHVEDIFDIQERIANDLIEKLKISLLKDELIEPLVPQKTTNFDAYELYLKGREQFELRVDLNAALSYFNQATKLDPTFGHAYIGLAYTLFYQCIFTGYRPKDALSKIQIAYDKAKYLSPQSAELFIIEGWLQFYFYHQIPLAIEAIEKAIELDPAKMDAYRILAYFYCFQGLFEKAIPLARKAYELEPLGYNAWFSYADIQRRAKNYDEAIKLFEPLISKFPDNKLLNDILALCYYYNGNIKQAGHIFQNESFISEHASIWVISRYIYQFYHTDKQPLSNYLSKLNSNHQDSWIQPSLLALLNYHIGHTDKADQLMGLAVSKCDFGLMQIISEPHWDQFRQRPAVLSVLREVGFKV